VEDAPNDFANKITGVPIMIWKERALKNWNQCELKAPAG
jgi:hypothetical protein